MLTLAALFVGPLAMTLSSKVNVAADWRTASRDSAGLAPLPQNTPEAVVQVYAARAFGWRGAVAVHTWIATKIDGAPSYTTYEVIGWRAFHGGSALSVHNGEPDRHWFGARPEILAELRGDDARAAITAIEAAVASYPYKNEPTVFSQVGRNDWRAADFVVESMC
jgi:hypothetical protein